ncbi:MAG TPA: hypothetical protein PKD68_05055 [Candidatus Saccharibacteria bacterium]|nr:hypothetical protein [Candidatus Saccharibacteria bacterium]
MEGIIQQRSRIFQAQWVLMILSTFEKYPSEKPSEPLVILVVDYI